GIGNLHAEPLMVAFLILAAVWFERKKMVGSALFFALAVSTKLLPLMFLPMLFFWKFKEQKRWFVFIALFCLLLFVPFFITFASGGFFQSIDLYYRKFEFNAGLYYLLRFVGQWATGYNLIRWLGPGLALLALSTILYLSINVNKWLEKGYALAEVGLWILLAYLFSLTTLHPWYLILPLAVSLCTRYISIWIWSYLITWTYQSYQITAFAENYALIFLEYAVLTCILVWEFNVFLKENHNRLFTEKKSEN
ncbi:MAG TPA: hypothetical protein PK037_13895, partial [Saprospiraceae bacterium]|nr:hypothetical protein [Saprospiraceae bacterium]